MILGIEMMECHVCFPAFRGHSLSMPRHSDANQWLRQDFKDSQTNANGIPLEFWDEFPLARTPFNLESDISTST